MSDPSLQSTALAASVQDRMAHMGMSGDLEHITLSRPEPAHFFSARALRHSLALLQALNLEGDPEAWSKAAQLLDEASDLVGSVVLTGQVR